MSVNFNLLESYQAIFKGKGSYLLYKNLIKIFHNHLPYYSYIFLSNLKSTFLSLSKDIVFYTT